MLESAVFSVTPYGIYPHFYICQIQGSPPETVHGKSMINN